MNPATAQALENASRLFTEWTAKCFEGLEIHDQLTLENCNIAVEKVSIRVAEHLKDPFNNFVGK